MALHRATKPRLIETARAIAKELIQKHGMTQIREVYGELCDRGLMPLESRDFWLGAVFRSPEFAWTGRYYSYSDPGRNIHERTVKVWTLAVA
jgi:hypothetical protein